MKETSDSVFGKWTEKWEDDVEKAKAAESFLQRRRRELKARITAIRHKRKISPKKQHVKKPARPEKQAASLAPADNRDIKALSVTRTPVDTGQETSSELAQDGANRQELPQKDHALIECSSEDEIATSPVTLGGPSKCASSCKRRRMTLLTAPTSTSSIFLRDPPASPTPTRYARHSGHARDSRVSAKTPRKITAVKQSLNDKPPSQSTPTKDARPWDYDIYDVMAEPEIPSLSSPTANFELCDAVQSSSSPALTSTGAAQGLLGSVVFTAAEISAIIQDLEDIELQEGDERLRMHIRMLRERLTE
ncbi:hypothetical protein K4K49_008118 [Colletotrichum sp. SAR 10_70]|nr:hypothetical protein K4K50_007818 [Colletotrichum sp. SAR 10_71]KAI8158113.1 hypothetical protein K4K49_008118 [Colletotrichum sp. SAR 10_70]KAI8221208.1 hypothetical protein K4K54_007994 [Colletotrichum sp. SAR 10_86]KAI8251131.1 hypothetical protein K4K58_009088 [Colletotrichum sp. SAR11_239]KAJ4996559.1 hypothetical protein K4K48_008342 [Colletotrichum sp. SAR 10_66]